MAQELASTAVGTSAAAAGMGAPAPTSSAPGFRFHPTDEELVRYYLRRKVCGKPFRIQAVTEYDVYKSEPWELADHSSLKTRDLEWYFFSPVDRKYGNGSRLNRATEQGYWKATGKDRMVHHNNQTIGTKKTLVFYRGRAPDGIRTNWIMHEYRLCDPELESARVVQNAFVLCRIFHKSGLGPPNADRYAPFVEEEWDAESGLVVPGGDDVANGDEAALVHYTDAHQDNQPLRIDPNSQVHMPLSLSRNKRSRHDDPEDSTTTFDLEKTVPPGYLKFISNLENKILNISMEKEALKIEVIRAQAMINTLQSRVQMLTNNDEEEVRVRI